MLHKNNHMQNPQSNSPITNTLFFVLSPVCVCVEMVGVVGVGVGGKNLCTTENSKMRLENL